ncbi:hypothetical protein N7481_002725 [Penicillium waksmanii]|uniref:uncharacterized protein n=1 Tax=Penicillium waksmanii TaxID=69791 RepID=UPI0025467ED4|nr:uncharacterized protein N7481_002725 [Penicillium waksmanii]KAJ5995748.1 hypothetical protein N7481_002725 [Penicillium waksmanii]
MCPFEEGRARKVMQQLEIQFYHDNRLVDMRSALDKLPIKWPDNRAEITHLLALRTKSNDIWTMVIDICILTLERYGGRGLEEMCTCGRNQQSMS